MAVHVASAVAIENLAEFDEVIDVRSPAEFAIDRIPGATNMPVLDDEERHRVGLLYSQDPFAARRLGAALVSRRIADSLQNVWASKPRHWKPLCYCWRGGLRSQSLAHVLRAVGWQAEALKGGYKFYRRHVLARLAILPQQLSWRVVCGPTGSAKSRILEALQQRGAQVLHLEELAHHRGSLLGAQQTQPRQKLFETSLWVMMEKFAASRPIFVEAESRCIGRLALPQTLWRAMQCAPCFALDVPLEARRDFLLKDYDYLLHDHARVLVALNALRPVHGEKLIDRWRDFLAEKRYGDLVDQLLVHHYDPLYQRSLARQFQGYDRAQRLAATQLTPAAIESMAQKIDGQASLPLHR